MLFCEKHKSKNLHILGYLHNILIIYNIIKCNCRTLQFPVSRPNMASVGNV